MLPTLCFFVVFVPVVQMSKFDPIKSSNQILFVSMLQIWNLRYLIHCWIIKYIGIESILFGIKMNVVLFSKVFNTIDYLFLSIVMLIIIHT